MGALSHGTTTACGPACDVLRAAKNGLQRHRWVAEMAIDLDRKRSYYAADYKGDAWDRMTFVMLSNAETWAALAVHIRPIEQEKVDEGEELRELQGIRGRAKMLDYVSYGNRDPDAYERFLTMLFGGVEDRNSVEASEVLLYRGATNVYDDNGAVYVEIVAGRRQATQRQLDRAMQLCFPSRLTPSDELTEDQNKGISEFKQDRQGNITIKTHAMEASKEVARLGGHYKDSLKISFDEQNALTVTLTRAWAAEVKERIQDLVEDPEAWMSEVVLGVKGRLGGG